MTLPIKTMKKLIFITIAIFLTLTTKAQEVDIQKTLANKIWKADVEAIKPKILLKLSFLPQLKNLSEREKEIVIKSTITTLEKKSYEFDGNGGYKVSFLGLEKNNFTGTYTFDKISKEFSLTAAGVTEKYSITTMTNERIHLTTLSNKTDLILISKK